MYVQRNVETRYRNHCCRGRTRSITYSVYVFVASAIQHDMRMHHIVISGLPRSTISAFQFQPKIKDFIPHKYKLCPHRAQKQCTGYQYWIIEIFTNFFQRIGKKTTQ
jgi:hypothetical protein